MSDYLMIDHYHSKINKRLANEGYFHKIHIDIDRDRKHYHITWVDENKYPSREFGNMTEQKAVKFLEGFWFALQIGLLTEEIE